MTNTRHVLGISGGKDSAALAIYLKYKYPALDLEYYFSDTGKELDETYKVIENLESYLGKGIIRLESKHVPTTNSNSDLDTSFDYFLDLYGGFLPSNNARWCTKNLKLDPFEKYVGDDPVVSYVGIRGDEDREGYISKKPNIQSIFPFRKNIWSKDITSKVLANENIEWLLAAFKNQPGTTKSLFEAIVKPIQPSFNRKQKIEVLLDNDTPVFNQVVFEYLTEFTKYPLASEPDYQLLDNQDVIIKKDVFAILEDSGVGVPAYYQELEFEVDGQIGKYARSRSGCYFCFYQQKIEWIWLYENHRELFEKAKGYEKPEEGFTWIEGETLDELVTPDRLNGIKREHLKKYNKAKGQSTGMLIDILDDDVGCASCFI